MPTPARGSRLSSVLLGSRSDGRFTPGKAPRSNSVASTSSSVRLNDPSLVEARAESSHKLERAWVDIFERYAHADEGTDDVYDFSTGEIIEDAGFLDAMDDYEIGCFGLPGAMGQDDSSGDEEASEDEDAEDAVASQQMERQEPETTELSSSEDELSNWTASSKKLGKPARSYVEARREQDAFKRDMTDFLELEAGRAEREESILFRRTKTESVKPMSVSLRPLSGISNSASPLSRQMFGKLSRYTPSSSVAPESHSVSPKVRGNSCTLQKTKPLYASSPLKGSQSPPKPSSRLSEISSSSSSLTPIMATVHMTGGNQIRSQAVGCEDDSSDDDLSILSPVHVPLPVTPRKSKVREETVTLSTALPSPPPSRSCSPQKPFLAPSSIKRSSSASASVAGSTGRRRRSQPVVEVVVRSASRLSSRPPAPENTRLPLNNDSKPKRSSPLKRSMLVSSNISTYQPPSPPTSRESYDNNQQAKLATSLEVSQRRSGIGPPWHRPSQSPVYTIESSDSEDELSILHAFPRANSPRRALVSNPKERSGMLCTSEAIPPSAHHQAPSTAPITPRPSFKQLSPVRNPQACPEYEYDTYYFPNGPPVASSSTSASPSSPKKRKVQSDARPSPAAFQASGASTALPSTTADARITRKTALSPSCKRGEEPWRVRKPAPLPQFIPALPTPPPSLPSEKGSLSPDRPFIVHNGIDAFPCDLDGDARSQEEDLDVFKVPSPRRVMPRPTPIKTSTPMIKTGGPSRTPGKSPEPASPCLITPRKTNPTATPSSPTRRFESEVALDDFPRLRSCISASPKRKRLSSVIRRNHQRPPDDDSEDSDDPLGL